MFGMSEMSEMSGMYGQTTEAKILELMDKTGYPIIQSNGQRLYGPPPNWPESVGVPAKGCEVFAGRLPRDVYEDELVPLFAQIGRIYQLRLMMDFSGSNRGFCYVTYTTRSDAIRAINALNNCEIRPNKRIGVVQSVDNCRLFIGNLPLNKTRLDVIEEMSKETEGVVNAIVYYNGYNKPNANCLDTQCERRGFAFVEFRTHRDAAMARRKLLPGKVKLFGADTSVDWAIPETILDDETMSKVTVLYVRYLSSGATEDMVKQLFEVVSNVQRVKRIKNYAFVHFESRRDAELALNYISRLNLNSTKLVENGQQLEVMWAKPPSAAAAHRRRTSSNNNSENMFNVSSNSPLNPMARPFDPQLKTPIKRPNRVNGYIKTQTQTQFTPMADRAHTLSSPKGLSKFWKNLWPNDDKEDMPWINHSPKTTFCFE